MWRLGNAETQPLSEAWEFGANSPIFAAKRKEQREKKPGVESRSTQHETEEKRRDLFRSLAAYPDRKRKIYFL
jgi:hypothetical protein